MADELVATDLDPAGLNASSPDACAVIVFHGMGQQVRWETIGTLVRTLDRQGYVQANHVHTRQAAFTDSDGKELRLGRAECLITSPGPGAPGPVDTHIYESYWAPLTEGAVGTRDVVRFLVSAGWDGIRYSMRDFRRHVLGRLQSYGRQNYWLQFGAALAFVLGLIALNLTTAWRVGRYVTADPRPSLDAYAAGFAQQTHLLWNLEIFAVLFGALMAVAVVWRRRGRTPGLLRMALQALGVAVLAAVPLVAIGIGVLMLAQRPAQWVPPALLTFGVVPEGIIAAASWGGAFLLSWYVKNLLVQYVGDVMVYVTAHQVNRFHELRDRIQSTAARVATTLYRKGGYKRYVFVGHSLGSVVAYDTLNRLILEEAQAGRTVDKVAALVTFGSPLDKTAFVFRTQAEKSPVREAIAATVQPLIQASRPAIPWVNLWSPQDVVSGELDFYSLPGAAAGGVTNRPDPDADIPLYAHVQFWENPALAHVVARAVNGAPALV